MSRRRQPVPALGAIKEDQEEAPGAQPDAFAAEARPKEGPLAEMYGVLDDLDAQVEARIARIRSATEDAVLALRQELKTKMMRLPKATRSMPLKELQEKFPGDFTAAALQEIRERCGEMARKAEEEATAAALAAGPGGRAAKRGREPDTVLHTVCAAPRGVPAMPPPRLAAPPPKFADAPAAAPAAAAAAPAAPMATPPPPAVPRPRPAGSFNGVPLQTPMPFAGVPVPLPVALLAQRKPGGRTRAAPDAAVVTTADGQQFAVGRGGVGVVPASHRAEVADLMRQQLEFFAAALGGAAALARR